MPKALSEAKIIKQTKNTRFHARSGNEAEVGCFLCSYGFVKFLLITWQYPASVLPSTKLPFCRGYKKFVLFQMGEVLAPNVTLTKIVEISFSKHIGEP